MPGTPGRRAEDKHTPPVRPPKTLKPEDADKLPFHVEFNPTPPEADESWHPIAQKLYASLWADPARVWMGPAAWAEAQVICEMLSRELGEQIIGWNSEVVTVNGSASLRDEGGIDFTPNTKETKQTPIMGTKTLQPGMITALLKWAERVGINEGDRLKLGQEVTFGTPPPSIAESEAPNLSLVRAEALA